MSDTLGLQNSLESYNTKEENIRAETLRILKDAQELVDRFESAGYPEDKILKMKQEYNELITAMWDALGETSQEQQDITKQELSHIQLEFSHLLRVESGESTTFNQLGKLGRLAGLDSSTVDFLDATKRTNQYQEDLIRKTMGDAGFEQGFTETHILGYNAEIGNYLITIDEFEQSFQNGMMIDGMSDDPNVVNSKALASYIGWVVDRYPEDIEAILQHFIDIVGRDNIKQLSDLWRKKQDTVVQRILNQTENGVKIITAVKDPKYIFTLEPRLQATALTIGDEVFNKELISYVNEHKDDPDFREKFITFYKVNKKYCSLEAQSVLDLVMEQIRVSGDIDEAGMSEIEKNINQTEIIVTSEEADRISSLLGLGGMPQLNPLGETKIGVNFGENINSTQSTPTSYLSQGQLNFSALNSFGNSENITPTMEDIRGKLSSMSELQLINTLQYFNNYLIPQYVGKKCPTIFPGITLEQIYTIVNEIYLNRMHENLRKQTNSLLMSVKFPGKTREELTPEQQEEISKISAQILEKVKGSGCQTELLREIDSILGGIEVSDEQKQAIVDLMTTGNEIQIQEARAQIALKQMNGEDITREEQQVLEKLEHQQENLQIISQLDTEQFTQLLNEIRAGKDPQEVMQDLRRNQEIKDLGGGVIPLKSGGSIMYVETQFGADIYIGNTKVGISKDELQLMQKSPEARENLVNFYNTLEQLELQSVWLYREQIFTAIASEKSLAFDGRNGDYINQDELSLFLKAILLTTQPPESIGEIQKLNDFKNIYLKCKDLNSIDDVSHTHKERGMTSYSNIGGIFYEKFVALKQGFDLSSFSNALNGKLI